MTLNTKKAVPKDLIDSLLADYKKPEAIESKLKSRPERNRENPI